jgi:hypothetical protein
VRPILPAGPYRTLTSPEGASFPYYVIPFDKDRSCEGPQTRDYLLANLSGATDLFVFSHGWNTDWREATKGYEKFITGFQELRVKHNLALPDNYKPVLVGIFWPSQAMAWFESERGPGFAAANPAEQDEAASALHATLREIAANLPPERRERFHALAQSEKLAEGEDRELAELLATVISGDEDAEAGTTQAPCADDLLAAATSLETPEPRLRGSRHRGRHGCGRGAGCSGRARRDLQASRVLSWLFLISSRPSLRADIVTRTASCARLLSTDKKRSKR